jgi:hypothetical protein
LEMGVSRTVCLGWPQAVILISPSQVGRITGLSHQCPTLPLIFIVSV